MEYVCIELRSKLYYCKIYNLSQDSCSRIQISKPNLIHELGLIIL